MAATIVTFPEEIVPGREPVGDGDHVVRQGECISFIAAKNGLKVDEIFNHPANTDLKQIRRDPNVLLPGDRVTVREILVEDHPSSTDDVHKFVLNAEPTFLRIKILDVDQPLAGKPFTLTVDGTPIAGVTGPDGGIQVQVPATALHGFLTIGIGSEPLQMKLSLGALDPVESNTGVQQRLRNLGFDTGKIDGIVGPITRGAIRNFQGKNGLEPTGKVTPETRALLQQQHGC